MKEYVYLKWQCPECGDIVISNKFRHHKMDFCRCEKCGIDLETYHLRMSFQVGIPIILEKINMNLFDELVFCMKEQDLLLWAPQLDKKIFLELQEVVNVRKMEDEILKGMRKAK